MSNIVTWFIYETCLLGKISLIMRVLLKCTVQTWRTLSIQLMHHTILIFELQSFEEWDGLHQYYSATNNMRTRLILFAKSFRKIWRAEKLKFEMPCSKKLRKKKPHSKKAKKRYLISQREIAVNFLFQLNRKERELAAELNEQRRLLEEEEREIELLIQRNS